MRESRAYTSVQRDQGLAHEQSRHSTGERNEGVKEYKPFWKYGKWELGIGKVLLCFECEDVKGLAAVVICCLLMYLQTIKC